MLPEQKIEISKARFDHAKEWCRQRKNFCQKFKPI